MAMQTLLVTQSEELVKYTKCTFLTHMTNERIKKAKIWTNSVKQTYQYANTGAQFTLIFLFILTPSSDLNLYMIYQLTFNIDLH